MPTISPLVRLSFGVTLLTVSLILSLDAFGVFPNETRARLDARKVVAELVAIQVSDDIGRGQFGDVATTLQNALILSDDILSMAVRLVSGEILTSSGSHADSWVADSAERSSTRYIEVPIQEMNRHWGALEISFKPPYNLFGSFFSSGSTTVVVLLIGVVGFLLNFIFLKRALSELDPSAVVPERVNSALNVLAEGLVMLDRSGRIVLVNNAFVNKIDQSQKTLIGSRLSDLAWSHGHGDSGYYETSPDLPWVSILERDVAPKPLSLSFRTLANEDLKFSVNAAPITAGDGSTKGVVVTFDDVTALEQKNSQLVRAIDETNASKIELEHKKNEYEILATRDPLTGVLNRRSLFEGITTINRDCSESDLPVSCLMVDIDHFKTINDSFGHGVGDEAIKSMANALIECVDSTALVARYGGEEFVVVLPGSDEVQAAMVAETMRELVSGISIATHDNTVCFNASFGVACDVYANVAASELIDRADKALYVAKDTGRNQVVQFSTISGDAQSTNGDSASAAELEVRTGNNADENSLDTSEIEEANVGLLVGSEAISEANETESFPMSSAVADNIHEKEGTALLMDRLARGINRSHRASQHLAVLIVYIDALEVVTNTYGSTEADKVVNTIKARLNGVLRESDIVVGADMGEGSVSRVGISELIVLLTDVPSEKDITRIVKRIRDVSIAPFVIKTEEFLIDSRIGVSLYPSDGTDPQTLLTNARAALRNAKLKTTHNGCLFFDKEMNANAEKQLILESQLPQALQREEFFLVYQPVVDIGTNRVVGFESLARWRNSHFGLVAPTEFIPAAERIQLIDPIGRWIFDRAMQQLSSWHAMGHSELTLAVNFSTLQIRQPEFIAQVVEIVARYNLAPSAVIIEITESIRLDDRERAAQAIEKLQAAGFKVALDDFGSSTSSLLHLKELPVDLIKIDQSFFDNYPSNEKDIAIISSILMLSNKLGISVVAEGVETVEQLQGMYSMGCDFVQGYVFTEAMSQDKATLLLTDSLEFRRMIRPLIRIQQEASNGLSRTSNGFVNPIRDTDRKLLESIRIAQG